MGAGEWQEGGGEGGRKEGVMEDLSRSAQKHKSGAVHGALQSCARHIMTAELPGALFPRVALHTLGLNPKRFSEAIQRSDSSVQRTVANPI